MVFIQAAKLSKILNWSKNLDIKLPTTNRMVAAIRSTVVDIDFEKDFSLDAKNSENIVTSDRTIAVITT